MVWFGLVWFGLVWFENEDEDGSFLPLEGIRCRSTRAPPLGPPWLVAPLVCTLDILGMVCIIFCTVGMLKVYLVQVAL